MTKAEYIEKLSPVLKAALWEDLGGARYHVPNLFTDILARVVWGFNVKVGLVEGEED